MGLRIMTALTVVRAALCEYCKSDAGTVNDGVIDSSCYSEFHYITLNIMFYTVVFFRALTVIETVECTYKITCDTAYPVESNIV